LLDAVEISSFNHLKIIDGIHQNAKYAAVYTAQRNSFKMASRTLK
jgi:hypothetical protein